MNGKNKENEIETILNEKKNKKKTREKYYFHNNK